MRERLDRRHEDLEAVVGRDREGVERHLVGRERPAPDQLQHRELPHAMEVDQLPRPAAVILVDRAVRGADEPGVYTLDLVH